MSPEPVPLNMEVIVSEEDLAVYVKFTGFDDVDFCIKAVNRGWKMVQVPSKNSWKDGMFVGQFPIYTCFTVGIIGFYGKPDVFPPEGDSGRSERLAGKPAAVCPYFLYRLG